MRTSTLITNSLLLACGLLFVGAEGRYYQKKPIADNYGAYVDWSRAKRQLESYHPHPDTTVARLNQVPLSDPGINEASPKRIGEESPGLPAPAEYLLPPAPDAPLTQIGPLDAQSAPTETKWSLGYEADEILVPPMPDDQAVQYDTLKLFTLLPTSSQPLNGIGTGSPGIGGVGPGIGAGIGELALEQDAAADTRTPFRENYPPGYNPNRQRQPSIEEPAAAQSQTQTQKQPVYTFVKTEPDGFLRWGVHIGGQRQ
ncbi:Hypothetical protein NTJ_06026 [Nesidiocoris tenuis]|uniref:DUF4794 domain-containing protein n=1 Tax=Nesidiocoris tenuis TaxID=355587 RepID=A0ABN7AS59_9HEMI|nr:Hypothetical protein NTJ_06026 [Nesidiocoris tenuis]